MIQQQQQQQEEDTSSGEEFLTPENITATATTTNAIPEEQVSINILNDDILDRVFQHLYFDDKIRLRQTCSRWRYLLDSQLEKIRALRLGRFLQGGYMVTSGLSFPTKCNHQTAAAMRGGHRSRTGQLFSDNFLEFPAELETQCFSVSRYDYLHRALKFSHTSITMLSLGQLNITYRLLMVIAHNLPNLEHLEIINCASRLEMGARTKPRTSISTVHSNNINNSNNSNSNNNNISNLNDDDRENHRPARELTSLQRQQQQQQQQQRIPSLEQFNSDRLEQQYDLYNKMLLYNQHSNEQQNMQERLLRSTLLRNCDLVRESKRHTYWPQLEHLLVKECNLLNEFSLCLILAITSKTLTHLVVESNQYLTGEFLNYCGPNLVQLRLNHCPMIRTKFLDDLVKLKQLLSPPDQKTFDYVHNQQPAATIVAGR